MEPKHVIANKYVFCEQFHVAELFSKRCTGKELQGTETRHCLEALWKYSVNNFIGHNLFSKCCPTGKQFHGTEPCRCL